MGQWTLVFYTWEKFYCWFNHTTNISSIFFFFFLVVCLVNWKTIYWRKIKSILSKCFLYCMNQKVKQDDSNSFRRVAQLFTPVFFLEIMFLLRILKSLYNSLYTADCLVAFSSPSLTYWMYIPISCRCKNLELC